MVRTATTLLISALAIGGCTKEQPQPTKAEIKATVDSIVDSRTPDLIRQNEESLSYRMTVEVKQKADSIVAARLGLAPAPPPPQR